MAKKGKPAPNSKPKPKDTLIGPRLILHAVGTAAIACVVYTYYTPSSSASPSASSTAPGPPAPWHYTIAGSVQREKWGVARGVVGPMLALHEPRVLTNTFASTWPAASSRQWTPEYLRGRLPKRLSGVYTNKGSPLSPLPDPSLTNQPALQADIRPPMAA